MRLGWKANRSHRILSLKECNPKAASGAQPQRENTFVAAAI
jgi:hypothetical protein